MGEARGTSHYRVLVIKNPYVQYSLTLEKWARSYSEWNFLRQSYGGISHMYPLRQINHSLQSVCKDLRAETVGIGFPEMASQVGGETDILIGIKYTKYFPGIVYMFPSGLSM